VYDTVYRRSRRAVTRTFHRIDGAIDRFRRRKVRVLFEAASPMSVSVFTPMLARLRRDPRLEFWFTTCDESWQAAVTFGGIGSAERIISPADARWMKFDAYVNTDFWNMTWLPRRTRRVHLFHGVAGKYGLDAPTRIAPVVATFDRLLFPNDDRLSRYVDAGLVDRASGQGALIGYPKVDCLVDGSLNRGAIERTLGINPSRPTILYAPTWSPYSSLNWMGKRIVNALAKMDVNVIVKLHDRSYDRAARASGGVDWRKELEPLRTERGVHIAVNADASPYLFAADALVTDHSSVGFEYMLLDRPIVVIDCPELIDNARISHDKVRLLRQGAYVAADPDSAAEAVSCGLADPHAHSAVRNRVARDLFFQAGGATARAVQSFYDLIELPAPVLEEEHTAADHRSSLTPIEARTT
jgi:hypothetical protein